MNGVICRNGDFEGYGGEFQRGIAQIFMISVDAAGETEWIETFSGSGREFLNHMIPTQSGGFLLSGSSSSYDGDFAGVGSGDRSEERRVGKGGGYDGAWKHVER